MSTQDDLKKDAWDKLFEYFEEIKSRIDLELESVYEDHFVSDNPDLDWDDPEIVALAEEELALKNMGIYIKGAKIDLADNVDGDEEQDLNEKISLDDLEQINSILETLRRSILNKSGGGIRSSFDQLHNVLEEGLIKIDYKDYDGQNIWNDTFALVDILESRRVELLFENRAQLIQIPKLLITFNNSLFKLIEREPPRIFDIPPRLFEEMIAEIFNKNGFYFELTKATRDGGRDIIAIRNNLDIKTKYIIECKRYAPRNKVDLSLVQRLLGVKIADNANKAILATTSSFTSDAISFVRQRCMWDIALKDYNDIMAWINDYNRLVKLTRN